MMWNGWRISSRNTALSLALTGFLAFSGGFAEARDSGHFGQGQSTWSAPTAAGGTAIAPDQLPSKARDTLRLIHAGGPFPFEKDGVVFGNRERLLAPRHRGYYREYTVATPRARNRGAKRIVCGGPAMNPERCFYSDDHYASFREITADAAR